MSLKQKIFYDENGTEMFSQRWPVELSEPITVAERDALTHAEGLTAEVVGIGKQRSNGTSWVTVETNGGKGKVIQTVQATTETLVTISTTTPTDSGLTASITPLKSTSKIRVTTFQPFRLFEGSVQDIRCRIDLLRDSTVILSETPQIEAVSTSGSRLIADKSNFSIEDNPTIPSTPVAITYKSQAFRLTGSPTIEMNRLAGGVAGAKSVIILEEIEQ